MAIACNPPTYIPVEPFFPQYFEGPGPKRSYQLVLCLGSFNNLRVTTLNSFHRLRKCESWLRPQGLRVRYFVQAFQSS